MTEFQKKVVEVVNSIPVGKVVSYGQVAAYVGIPRGARQVGWALRQLEDAQLPWWRVVNNAGQISIKGNWYNDKQSQKQHLEQEGVEVNDSFTLDMKIYRYVASEDQMRLWQLEDAYLKMVWEKFRGGY